MSDHKWMVTFSFNEPSPSTNETAEVFAPSATDAIGDHFQNLDIDELAREYGRDGTLRKVEATVHGLELPANERHEEREPGISLSELEGLSRDKFLDRL